MSTEPDARPLVLISSAATAEEIAAVVAVLQSVSAGSTEPEPRTRSEWSSPHRLVRRAYRHGVGGWRSSALPG